MRGRPHHTIIQRQCFSSPTAWAGASRDNEMQRVHILCNVKQQQLLMLVDFALLNSFYFLM
jgi:uncharacterized membrane-anchored protein